MILRELARAQTTGDACEAECLFRASRQTPSHGEAILESMLEAAWVARNDEEDWMLARRIDDIRLSDVLSRFCISADAVRALPDDGLSRQTADDIKRLLGAADTPLPALFARQDVNSSQSG